MTSSLWTIEGNGGGGSTIGSCTRCHRVTEVKLGTWSPIRPCEHWCRSCIKEIESTSPMKHFIEFEDLQINNFWGVE